MKQLNYILLLVITGLVMACGVEDSDPTPMLKPVEPELPVDPKLLYNGIRLPDLWPPVRSYSSDLEKGMTPFYLERKPTVIDISVGRQLFVDDFLIASTNLTRQFHYPQYYAGNPVLAADREWEKSRTSEAAFTAPFSDGVWFDEMDGKFKMWYFAAGGSYSINGSGVTCYSESADGIEWDKPNLGILPGTNVVDYGSERDASVVWLDKQESNLSKRYKMFLVARESGIWKYHYKTSSDGKSWRATETSRAIADRSTVYKNAFRNIWVFSMRHNVRVNSSKLVRARDYSEHVDPALGTRNAEAILSSFWFGPWPGEQRHPRYSSVDPAIYNHDAIPYESLMLGFFTVWQGPENDQAYSHGEIKRNQVMLGYSRDGYSWFREDRNPFFAVNETKEAWNYGNLQSVAGVPLIVGDKLYFYLSGRRLTEVGKEITTTGLAFLRRDGFASMKGTGELQTPPLTFKGKYFFVNARVEGKLRIELLDANGAVLPGFSKADCLPFQGDQVKSKVVWNGNPSLLPLQGKMIIIKFYMDNGELFSFWVSPEETGESQGYTAGGGPGLNSSGLDIK